MTFNKKRTRTSLIHRIYFNSIHEIRVPYHGSLESNHSPLSWRGVGGETLFNHNLSLSLATTNRIYVEAWLKSK